MAKKKKQLKVGDYGKRRTVPGSSPGLLIADPNAEPSAIRVIAYNTERIEERTLKNPQEVKQLLTQPWSTVWINVDGLGDVALISEIGAIFGLHRLSLEDVVNVHQRPKAERYDTYQFVVLRAMSRDRVVDQMSLFLGPRFVLTFQEHPGDCFSAVRERLRQPESYIRRASADYLAYALMDAVVDAYFPLLESLGEQLEELQDLVLTHPTRATMERIQTCKRELLFLRRAIWPLREEINALLRDGTSLFSPETRVYVRDCYDHTLQLLDILETLREIAASLMDMYLSSLNQRMSEVMRILTVLSAIFVPLTFVVGVYGMNFNTEISPWNMPELNWTWGYPGALALMGGMTLTQVLIFWRKGWLRSLDKQ